MKQNLLVVLVLMLFISSCSSSAIISDQRTYFGTHKRISSTASSQIVYLFYEFALDKLLISRIVQGSPQARLYIIPRPAGEVESELGTVFLIDKKTCDQISVQDCLINVYSEADKLKSINPEKRKYYYLAVFSLFHPINHNNHDGAINIIVDNYGHIELDIRAQSKPFIALKTKRLVQSKKEIMALWEDYKKKKQE